MDKFPYSSAPLRRVKGVQFGILDPEFLVSFSVLASWSLGGCTALVWGRDLTSFQQEAWQRGSKTLKVIFDILRL
jgi:hypothetical protein